MKVIVLGSGVIGVTSAWFLAQAGHEVTVIDRQPDAGLETSFANGAQISVSFCEPWANAGAPLKVLKWLLRDDSPLLFRPRLDPYQWRWGVKFLTQCTDAAFARNVQQLVALGAYSHESLKGLVAKTGIECRIYGMRRDLKEEVVEGNLRFQPFSEDKFISDLATSRAVIGGGGFTLMGEAVYLQKPMLAIVGVRNASVGFALVLAYAMGERPSRRQWLGIALLQVFFGPRT